MSRDTGKEDMYGIRRVRANVKVEVDMTGRALEASGRKGIFANSDTSGVERRNQYRFARASRRTTITDPPWGQTDATVGLVANARRLGRRKRGEDEEGLRKRKGLEQARAEYHLVDPVPMAATRESIRKPLAE